MDQYHHPGQWPDREKSRFASRIVSWTSDQQEANTSTSGTGAFVAAGRRFRGIGLIGLADHEGVRLNGGRIGAADGPNAFRNALARHGSNQSRLLQSPLSIVDVGDIQPGDTLDETHQCVRTVCQRVLDVNLMPVGIGGGHDLTLPLVSQVAHHLNLALDGIYFDAHLDVREELGSGMPFRRLLESGSAKSLRCIGYEPFVNSLEHESWFLNHGGQLDDFEPQEWPAGEAQFVSLDLDVIDACHAPGVSATNPCGMDSNRIANYAYAAGRAEGVVCFDIMELCPVHDRNGQTARLAAHLFLSFLRGVGARLGDPTTSADWKSGGATS